MFDRHHRKKYIHMVLLILWMLFIFSLSAQPAEESAELSGGVLTQLIQTFQNSPVIGELLKQDWAEALIRKAAHFGEYVVLGMLLFVTVKDYVLYSRKTAIISWLIGLCYAVIDELHQSFVPGRSCEFRDVGIDAAGVSIGVLLLFAYFGLEHIRKKGYTTK